MENINRRKSRKRVFRPETWKRSQEKLTKYSASSLPIYPTCNHNSKAYQCSKLSMVDVLNFHKLFYNNKQKVDQDNFVLKYCSAQSIRRRRPTTITSIVKRKFSTTYHVRRKINSSCVPVCRQAFLNILQIKKDRVVGVIKRNMECGLSASETRGGDRYKTKFSSKKIAVIEFVRKFQPLESHYCRASSSRLYLASDLNIRNMHKMYMREASPDGAVKESYFRRIFNTNFNIGFGNPRTDVCSTCLSLDEKLKTEKVVAEKSKLLIEKRVHKLKAKAFYSFLKVSRQGLLTLSFDCQKNQPLPKLPDQAAYYSRQLYIFNFTIVTGTSHSTLTPANVHSYAWTEDQFCKGSNEIASALFHRLNNTNFEGIEVVRLMADGCGGQNKNSIIIGMCCKWLLDHAPQAINRIEIIFPVTGHSFIPPDRVFANIEKKIKKKEVIVDPGTYIDIFKEHATVFKLGIDVQVSDWKSAILKVLKLPGQWHFKFITAKRFILHRGLSSVKIQGENAYRSDTGAPKYICKRGMKITNINPEPKVIGISVSDLKLTDVDNLLRKHYGANWKEQDFLRFYKCVMDSEHNQQDHQPEQEDYLLCDPMQSAADSTIMMI